MKNYEILYTALFINLEQCILKTFLRSVIRMNTLPASTDLLWVITLATVHRTQCKKICFRPSRVEWQKMESVLDIFWPIIPIIKSIRRHNVHARVLPCTF